MAYEVTKRIKGHDYLYIVKSYRDPETNRRKTRWQYAGAIDHGKVREPHARAGRRITRDEIIDAVARLLPFRDPEHITVAVIGATAGASRGVFYRHFRNQQDAIDAALNRMAEDFFQGLPSLEAKPSDLQDAKSMLRRWCETPAHCTRLYSVLQRALRQQPDKKRRVLLTFSKSRETFVLKLSLFLRQLNDAGFAHIADPLSLARAIRGAHLAQRIAALLTPPEHELPLPEFDELYQLIEQAVFGPAA